MIIYFTGTGNSEYVAKRIAEAVGDEVLNLFDKIKGKDYSAMTSEKPWVLAAPTYAWQMPNVVKEWLEKTKLEGNKDIYFVLTCGGSIGNAATYAKKYCKEHGMNFRGLTEVVMPENYIAMFSAPEKEEAIEIIKGSESKIGHIAEKINQGKDLETKTSLYGAVISGPINKGFYLSSVNDKKYRVLDSCTGCGLCEKMCVLNNITLKDGKPVWGGNCTQCMACITGCPSEAIEYGNKSVGKPRYRCPL